jgi:hypothetical protein
MKLTTRLTILASLLCTSTVIATQVDANNTTKRDSHHFNLCYEHDLKGWCWTQIIHNGRCTSIASGPTQDFGSLSGGEGIVCRVHRTTDCNVTKDSTMVCHETKVCNFDKTWSATAKAIECVW